MSRQVLVLSKKPADTPSLDEQAAIRKSGEASDPCYQNLLAGQGDGGSGVGAQGRRHD